MGFSWFGVCYVGEDLGFGDVHYDIMCCVGWFAASWENLLPPFSTLKMEAADSSEMVVTQKMIQCQKPGRQDEVFICTLRYICTTRGFGFEPRWEGRVSVSILTDREAQSASCTMATGFVSSG